MFSKRTSIEQVEEGFELAPKFDSSGLIPVVTTDIDTGELLMHGYMNVEALRNTLSTGQMHYFSRSRQVLWHKGASSGFFQNVKELLIDDDQDALWAKVEVLGGASCHVGYRSCFYRKIEYSDGKAGLLFTDTDKVFDPEAVYGEEPNPTKL
jgi:phosphoribosyl-AMP cyclohydrolase